MNDAAERLTDRVTTRLRPSEHGRLRALRQRLPLPGGCLLRELVLLGLEQVESDPAVLVRPRPQLREGA